MGVSGVTTMWYTVCNFLSLSLSLRQKIKNKWNASRFVSSLFLLEDVLGN